MTDDRDDPLSAMQELVDRAETARERFGSSYDLRDLDEAIDAWTVVTRQPLLPHMSASFRATILTNDGGLHLTRYLAMRRTDDLDAALRSWVGAVPALVEAVDERSAEREQLTVLYASIAGGLEERYARRQSLEDLDEALAGWRRAVQGCPDQVPFLTGYLFHLGRLQFARYQATRRLGDLDDAVSTLRRAVLRTGAPWRERVDCLDQLAVALTERFTQRGDRSDLDEAVVFHEQAIDGAADDGEALPRMLQNLARSLHQRWLRVGSLEDSARCLEVLDTALDHVADPQSPLYVQILKNIKIALESRYTVTQSATELEQALRISERLSALGHFSPALSDLLDDT